MKFIENYNEAKDSFYEVYLSLKDQLKVEYQQISIVENLSMDVIEIVPDIMEKCLVILTGLHGIEGYVGNYLMRHFIKEQLKHINLTNTGVILVNAINPYGMKHYRKVNENNVDLNRNFVDDFDSLKENVGYSKNANYFLPKRIDDEYKKAKRKFYFSTLGLLLRNSSSEIKDGALKGQYKYASGFYYGGKQLEKSSQEVLKLVDHARRKYPGKMVVLDLHTGFGPRYQMSIVNSPLEKRTSEELKKVFGYPLVQKATGNEFYKTSGDLVEYLDKLYKDVDNKFFSTCLEFGTIGEGFWDQVDSLRIMLQENNVHHSHKSSEGIYLDIKNDFRKLYMPNDPAWLDKAVKDFYQGLSGIIRCHLE